MLLARARGGWWWWCPVFPYLKSQIICLGVPPIQPGDKVASRSPKGRLGDPKGPGLCLLRFARHLGGSPPDIGRLTHHGEAPGVRSSGIEVTLAAAAAAAARAPPRVRASTLFARSARRRRRRPPQRSLNGSLARPASPGPAPPGPRAPAALRLSPDSSAPGPRSSPRELAAGHAHARSPPRGLLLVSALSAFRIRSAFLFGGGAPGGGE